LGRDKPDLRSLFVFDSKSNPLNLKLTRRLLTTILVVDDNPRVRRALRVCLELHQDWKVCGEAENGQEAIDLVCKNKPDVVLLDYAMPVMNGLEAARSIAAIASPCTMLLFTMYASEQLSRLAHDAGIQAVVSKGVGGMKEIVTAIEKLLPEHLKFPQGPDTIAS
jgi:DNA-binding NarL/FixJ family response regulator